MSGLMCIISRLGVQTLFDTGLRIIRAATWAWHCAVPKMMPFAGAAHERRQTCRPFNPQPCMSPRMCSSSVSTAWRSAEDNTIYRHAARSPTDPAPHDEGRYVTTRFPKRGRHRPRSKSDVAADHEAAGALTPLWLTLDGPGLVPWGMVAGPDRSLYVAVDTSYEARPSWPLGFRFRGAWPPGPTAACTWQWTPPMHLYVAVDTSYDVRAMLEQ